MFKSRSIIFRGDGRDRNLTEEKIYIRMPIADGNGKQGRSKTGEAQKHCPSVHSEMSFSSPQKAGRRKPSNTQ